MEGTACTMKSAVGRDGRTPGEQVLHMRVKEGRGRKFADRFARGTCQWRPRRNGETIIGTETLQARTMRRLHEDKRWSKEATSSPNGTPWAQGGDDEEKPIGMPIDLLAEEERRGLPPQMPEGSSVVSGLRGEESKERASRKRRPGEVAEEAARVDVAARRCSDTGAGR
eukprot:12277679-Heterocapsa_arctica.AAC.1